MHVADTKKRTEQAFAAQQKSSAAGTLIVVDDATIAKPYGFVFFMNTQRYLETGERRYSAIGAGPVIFDRQERRIVMLPTHLSATEAIVQYEAGRLVGTIIERL